jgi:hypothetical protein
MIIRKLILLSLAALPAVASSNAWSDPTQPEPLLRSDPSQALDNGQFVHHGFQGETSPDGAGEAPAVYAATHPLLAISSPACAPFRATVGACLNYFEVDAYIALGDSISINETRSFAKIHPWHGTPYRDRIIEKEVTTFADLKTVLTDLVQDCYVVRHLFISSHGFKNHVVFHDGDAVTTDIVSVDKMLAESGIACALAPTARVQFDGCSIACQDSSSNGASDLRSMLAGLTLNPAYQQIKGMSPFMGTEFLFNSDKGSDNIPIGNFLFGNGWHYNHGISADGDSAILYQLLGSSIITDVPESSAHACDYRGAGAPGRSFVDKPPAGITLEGYLRVIESMRRLPRSRAYLLPRKEERCFQKKSGFRRCY